jgi:hypothetical protein
MKAIEFKNIHEPSNNYFTNTTQNKIRQCQFFVWFIWFEAVYLAKHLFR